MSLIAWLNTSPDDERRMRELVRMFSEPGTLDDLGIGQVRDALGDKLFPGSSTLHTRARYYLFIPWIFKDAARNASGSTLLSRAQNSERRLIVAMHNAGATDGLIGRVAGEQVRSLPSSLYWSALRRYGILRVDRGPNQLRQIDPSKPRSESADEPIPRDWDIAVSPPPGFPGTIDGGFTMARDEAEWLRERMVTATHGSYLSALLTAPDYLDYTAATPWEHPALTTAPASVQQTVEHARLFSLVINGAALLYNLLVAERYEVAGFTAVEGPVDRYRERLDTWASDIAADAPALAGWDLGDFWRVVHSARTTPVSVSARTFITDWAHAVQAGRADGVVADNELRGWVADREIYNKKQQSRLSHPRLLATWRGAAGANPLVYRWPQLSRIVTDIHEGLTDAGA